LYLSAFVVVEVDEADFAEVAEDGAGVEVDFAEGVDVADGAREFAVRRSRGTRSRLA
jgi:hypothetical protein